MNGILIIGQSGSGKSTAAFPNEKLGIKGLDPKETLYINVSGKPLPMKGWTKFYNGKVSENGNYLEKSDAMIITQVIDYVNKKREDLKNIVIDDAQYIMAFEYMSRAKETGYNKFTDIGANLYNIFKICRELRKDLLVFFLWHPEVDNKNNYKAKTIGKMVDEYLTIEGLFSVVLYSKTYKEDHKMVYKFVTNYDGEFPAKSPIDMFEDIYIPNDLGLVREKFIEYYNG